MGSHNQVTIDLIKRSDRDGKTYYMCFPDLPFQVRLDELAIFIFTAEDGEEQLILRRKETKSLVPSPGTSAFEEAVDDHH